MASRSVAVGRAAAGRRPFRGRTAIALGLVTFLVVTTSVVFRRARGSAAANRLHELGSQVDELRAQRTRLDGEVKRAASLGDAIETAIKVANGDGPPELLIVPVPAPQEVRS